MGFFFFFSMEYPALTRARRKATLGVSCEMRVKKYTAIFQVWRLVFGRVYHLFTMFSSPPPPLLHTRQLYVVWNCDKHYIPADVFCSVLFRRATEQQTPPNNRCGCHRSVDDYEVPTEYLAWDVDITSTGFVRKKITTPRVNVCTHTQTNTHIHT